MDNSIFYNDVKCIITNEGKSLFAKQSNGVKFAKVGAVLFSDVKGTIKDAYDKGGDEQRFLKNLSLKQLKNYTTLIFSTVSYTMEGSIYVPNDYSAYNKALEDANNLIPIQIAYGNNENINVDDEGLQEITYTKYMSYDLLLKTNSLPINSLSDMNFDGFAILGLPFKSLSSDTSTNINIEQDFATIAIVYFPNEKLQVLKNQSKNVAMNVEMHVFLDEPYNLSGLGYIDNKGLVPKNTMRFINGLHLTNDGLHNRG